MQGNDLDNPTNDRAVAGYLNLQTTGELRAFIDLPRNIGLYKNFEDARTTGFGAIEGLQEAAEAFLCAYFESKCITRIYYHIRINNF